MKKTVTANVSGIIFHIDEDAYDKLSRYLDSLRKHFSSEEGGEEILSDIESRIAEMLQSKISSRKEVITLADVSDVIFQLGEPFEIGQEAAEPDAEPKKEQKHETSAKKLFRDHENSIIGGVAAGIAAYFNIDVVWVRIAFVITTFFWGFGPIVYLILWIVVPKAITTADRLSMKGESVNISNIEKSIKEELNDLKTKFEKFSEENFGSTKKKSNNRVNENKLESSIINFFTVVFKIIAVVAGFVFMIAGISALTLLLISLFTPYPGPVHFPWFFSIQWFLGLYLVENWIFSIAVIGVALVAGIPLLMLISAGAGMTFRVSTKSKFWSIAALVLWQIGLVMCIFSFIYAFNNSECRHNAEFDNGNAVSVNGNKESAFVEKESLTKQLNCFFVNIKDKGIAQKQSFSEKDTIYMSNNETDSVYVSKEFEREPGL